MSSKFFQSKIIRLSLILAVFAVLVVSLYLIIGRSTPTIAVKAQEPLSASVTGGGEASAGAANAVVLDALPQAIPSAVTQPQQIRLHTGVSANELQTLKQKAASQGITPLNLPWDAPQKPEASPLTPSAFVNFAGMSENGWVPSDQAIAVGQSYVVQVVNESIAVYNKTGVIQSGYPKSLQDFLCGGCSNSIFDPRAYYDWQYGRYVILLDKDNGISASSSFYIAASQTNNPLGAWWIYEFTYGGSDDFGDFPTLGYDTEGIYTCDSTFSNSLGNFNNNKCFIIPKTRLYQGASFSYYYYYGFNVGGTLVDSIQPVKTMETNKPRAEFMVNSFNILWGGGQCYQGCSGLVVWAISNPFAFLSNGPAPTVSAWVVPTSTYILPPDANAPGCPNCVATNDTRISAQPTYNAGSIWTAVVTGVGSPAHAGILWWEVGVSLDDNGGGCTGRWVNLCPLLNNAYLKQEGLYWYTTDDAYFPALQPDAENNVMMTLAYSGSDVTPSVVYAGRRINQVLNGFHDGGIYLAVGGGSITYGNRWGDYFATAIDQTAKPNKLWVAGPVLTGANFWGTQIGEIDYRNKNAP